MMLYELVELVDGVETEVADYTTEAPISVGKEMMRDGQVWVVTKILPALNPLARGRLIIEPK